MNVIKIIVNNQIDTVLLCIVVLKFHPKNQETDADILIS